MFFRKKIEECGIRNGKMTENKKIKIGLFQILMVFYGQKFWIYYSPDCIFHAGDVDRPEILDAIRLLGALYVVRGNNDGCWAQNLRRSLNFTVGNVKFFMVHDRKDVAWELGDTQVVIFGHSHQYFAKEIDGRLWLNPGSCGRSRFGGDVTMAVMTVENGSWQVEKIVF